MLSNLAEPVRAYIAASNSFDVAALVATFSEGALVNDHRDEFLGQERIRDWAQREIVDDRVTMQVITASHRGHSASVAAIIDGNFDRTGLPDPLVLTFYFSISADLIDQLIIVHNKPAS
jgi:hypothetical protein